MEDFGPCICIGDDSYACVRSFWALNATPECVLEAGDMPMLSDNHCR